MPCDELNGQLGYLLEVIVECEVASIEEVEFGSRQIFQVGARTRLGEEEIILSPGEEKGRTSLTEPLLPSGIGGQITLVIIEQVEHDLVSTRSIEPVLVEEPGIWIYELRLSHSI